MKWVQVHNCFEQQKQTSFPSADSQVEHILVNIQICNALYECVQWLVTQAVLLITQQLLRINTRRP